MQFSEPPALRRPVLLVAFSGWVDGGEVATRALRFLVDAWDAKKFAHLDPEEFYNFSRIRPQVRRGPGQARTLSWPETNFYYHVDPQLDRDFVLLVGIEPNFKWRTFSQEILEVCQSVGIVSALTLGGVIADVPHTGPSQITVFTSDPDLRARFPELGERRGGYEGPTGIIGVIGAGLTKADIPLGNIRGAVPHYVAATPNPKVRHALLARLSELYGLGLDLAKLEAASRRFERRVNRSLAERPEMADYIKRLQARAEEAEDSVPKEESVDPDVGPGGTEELPSGADVVRQLEEFFRERSTGQDDDPASGPQRS